MENGEIAQVFAEMADLTQIVGGDPHRIRSFRRSARVLESLPDSAAAMIRFGTLSSVPGIGPGTLHRVKQILKSGTCDDHRTLTARLPPGLREMLEVKGIGASTVRALWSSLRIRDLAELEYAARSGALLRLPRWGEGRVHNLLRALKDHEQRAGRFPWADSQRVGTALVGALQECSEVQNIALGGSLRRGKATVKDLDILVASDDGLAVASKFVTLPRVERVLVQGSGRCSVLLHSRQQVDLRVLPPENWGAGLHYFTGSKLHNIAIRARGLTQAGLKISDKGIFVRDTEVLVHSAPREEDVFAAVGLPPIPPELRENTGEIEAAASGRLPRLVTASDLRGDLHMHTTASDGRGTVMDMAQQAVRLGHAYIAITDHTKALTVARGLDERRLAAQVQHVRELAPQVPGVRVLAGTEVDILRDGRLDLDLSLLAQLDWVVASVHLDLDQDGAEMTDRLIAAMETGVVDCIGHPTGRRLDKRSGATLELQRLLKAARRLGVALEINGNPYRMDLPDIACRQAREAGVLLALNTDAHAPAHLSRREFGLHTARRGWVEAKHVLNTRPWADIAQLRRDRLRTGAVAVTGTWRVPEAARPVAAQPATAEHYPELDEELVADEAPPTGPPLEDRLQGELDNALRARIDTWLREGGDPELEQALEALGDNAMATAFALLHGG